jgi:hypothetical protein
VDAVPGEVRVAVHQARQDGATGGDGAVGAAAELGRGAHRQDRAGVELDEAVLDRLVAPGREHAAAQDHVLAGKVGHRLDELLETPGGGFRHERVP